MNMKEKISAELQTLDFAELSEIASLGFDKISTSADFPRFLSYIDSLPQKFHAAFDFTRKAVSIGEKTELTGREFLLLSENLKNLIPWRKGPFNLFDIKIDSEWRSDLKFARLEKSGIDFKGKTILDIGSGNGYYIFRLLGKGAKSVIGIEPYLLNFMQFNAIKKYAPETPAITLPVPIEAMPENYEKFDVVLSMGVFYHRKSPFEHLARIKGFLQSEGKMALETLVVEGEEGKVLVPEDRYAKMRNVWFIPSVPTLIAWLKRMKFRNIEVIDVSETRESEQRKTDWMPWESLTDFLDKNNPNKTVEGYPAPLRAMITAEK